MADTMTAWKARCRIVAIILFFAGLLMPSFVSAYAEQKVTASDGTANDWFGFSVSVKGNFAVIAAANKTIGGNSSQGAVYVFIKSGGIWTQWQKLTASDGGASDQFGYSVAFDGNKTIVVGAPNASNKGAVYVFEKTGSIFAQTQKLVASDGVTLDLFGRVVGIDGNTILIGAGGTFVSGQYVLGSVYSFEQSGSTWLEKQRILSPHPADNAARFGEALSISGTTALIGAWNATIGGNAGQGIGYVYTKSGSIWTLSTSLVASDGAAHDHLGSAVSLQGTKALLSADNAYVSGSQQGAVYYFSSSGTSWSQTNKFSPSVGTTGFFGASVSLLNNTALIGAYGENSDTGAAYVYNKALLALAWTQTSHIVASDGAVGDVFGYFSAVDTGTALIGAYTADIGPNSLQGAAYFYSQNCATSSGGLCP